MAKFDFEIVGKIGSMALVRKAESDIDYNVFSRIGAEAAARNDLGELRRGGDRPAGSYAPQRRT